MQRRCEAVTCIEIGRFDMQKILYKTFFSILGNTIDNRIICFN